MVSLDLHGANIGTFYDEQLMESDIYKRQELGKTLSWLSLPTAIAGIGVPFRPVTYYFIQRGTLIRFFCCLVLAIVRLAYWGIRQTFLHVHASLCYATLAPCPRYGWWAIANKGDFELGIQSGIYRTSYLRNLCEIRLFVHHFRKIPNEINIDVKTQTHNYSDPVCNHPVHIKRNIVIILQNEK